MNPKGTYITLNRRARAGLDRIGALRPLDNWAERSRTGRWVRSQLSIYDLADLLRWDLPWWTLDASDQVDAFLRGRRDARVFEWGSGASTVWLARRAAAVVSVEHDPEWAEQVNAVAPPNVQVRVVPPQPAAGLAAAPSRRAGYAGLDFAEYVAAVDDGTPPYDLVVIDGRARESCLARCAGRVAPDGLVVFDNVDRERYRTAIAAHGDWYDIRVTRGLTPCLPYPTRTALLRPSAGPP